MAKNKQARLAKKNLILAEEEVLIAQEQLGKPALPDPVVISRLFKRITNKTLKNIRPDPRRVITRPFRPATESHSVHIVDRVLALDEPRVKALLKHTLRDFAHRHKDIHSVLMANYQRIACYIEDPADLSDERKLLLGSCFTMEYSIESAALFNPSIVIYPKQNNVQKGQTRVIFSFRATGEGHISSIVFRSALVDRDNSIFLESVSPFLGTPEVVLNAAYDRGLFQAQARGDGPAQRGGQGDLPAPAGQLSPWKKWSGRSKPSAPADTFAAADMGWHRRPYRWAGGVEL